MANQKVTIEDVAKAAGVSRQTVSRVINQAKSVSSIARERVERAIDELGYVPNLAARRMGGARSYILIALIERGTTQVLPLGEMLTSGLEACAARGYHIIFEQIEAPKPGQSEAEIARSVAPIINALQPDGMVLLPPLDQSTALLNALKGRTVEVACLAERKEFGRTVPGLDEADFAESATQKLLELGHRQVGFVPAAAHPPRSARRIEGYRRKLAHAGSRAHRHFVAPKAPDPAKTKDLARSWLTPTIRPTAVVAETAATALAFAQTARELKLAVPRELSILSLEDDPVLAKAKPPISSFSLPYGSLFAGACARLMDKAEKRETGQTDAAFEFVERQSTAKAPRSV